mmetsp:Transcript_43798/g.110815  ORF Transcript_43798/g.110815 Transcript_43798/m.110815 type:complete len:165 (+) Transcript_43798:164-658(+)
MAKNRAKGKRPGAIGNAVVDGVLAELKKAGGDAAVGAAPDGVSPNSNGHAGGARAPAPLPEAALESQINAQERQIAALKDECRERAEEAAELRASCKESSAQLVEARDAVTALEGQLAAARATEAAALDALGATSVRLTAAMAALTASAALAAGMYLRGRQPGQ